MAKKEDDARARQAKIVLGIRRDFGRFFAANPPAKRYIYGRHTIEIMRECQRAIAAVDRGECYYVRIHTPPQHGKSDIVSRRLPTWFLLNHPDDSCILASYSSELASYLCGHALSCASSMAPYFGLAVSHKQRKDFWTADGYKGVVRAVGLGASITGFPAKLLIVDDYCKNRAEAESEVVRERTADSFRSDLFSRLAPAHAVIVMATRWHEDDLAGRLDRWADEDSRFPRFRERRFPAENPDGTYLFPERYPASHYERQKAMGSYAWQSIWMNDPKPRQGNMLRADLVRFVSPNEVPAGLRWRRGWDIASTEKELVKDDPDFSAGTLAAYKRDTRAIYIRDVSRGQWSTHQRDERIVEAALRDGPGVEVEIEAVAGYVDTYKRIRRELSGKAIVRKSTPEKDKVSRASMLAPAFECGNVFIVREDHVPAWYSAWQSEFLAFPSGRHDDQIDSLGIALWRDITRGPATFGTA